MVMIKLFLYMESTSRFEEMIKKSIYNIQAVWFFSPERIYFHSIDTHFIYTARWLHIFSFTNSSSDYDACIQ